MNENLKGIISLFSSNHVTNEGTVYNRNRSNISRAKASLKVAADQKLLGNNMVQSGRSKFTLVRIGSLTLYLSHYYE